MKQVFNIILGIVGIFLMILAIYVARTEGYGGGILFGTLSLSAIFAAGARSAEGSVVTLSDLKKWQMVTVRAQYINPENNEETHFLLELRPGVIKYVIAYSHKSVENHFHYRFNGEELEEIQLAHRR